MINKISVGIVVFTLVSLFALAMVCFAPKGDSEILIVLSKDIVANGHSIDILEKIGEDGYLVTYESKLKSTIEAVDTVYDAVIIGTNCMYPFVVDVGILCGGFFIKEDQKLSVTINEKAAFDLFGSVDIIGNEIMIYNKTYTISGVINDTDIDNRNVYIYASNIGVTMSDSVAVRIGGGNNSLEYVLNRFEQVGISNQTYTFFNTGVFKDTLRGKFFVAIKASSCIVLFGVVQRYKRQFKLWIQWALTAAWTSVTIIICQSFLQTCLYWYDMPNLTAIKSESFSMVISQMRDLWVYSDVLFVCVITSVVVFWIAGNKKSHRH